METPLNSLSKYLHPDLSGEGMSYIIKRPLQNQKNPPMSPFSRQVGIYDKKGGHRRI